MDVIFTKEFIGISLCFLVVLCTVACTMVIEVYRKLDILKEYLKYNSKLLEQIKSMLEKKGF